MGSSRARPADGQTLPPGVGLGFDRRHFGDKAAHAVLRFRFPVHSEGPVDDHKAAKPVEFVAVRIGSHRNEPPPFTDSETTIVPQRLHERPADFVRDDDQRTATRWQRVEHALMPCGPTFARQTVTREPVWA
jgi:hypothetical protein